MTMNRFRASKRQRAASDVRWFARQVLPELLAGIGLIGAALIVPAMLLM